jgi:RNA polymerase sigma-70 factor (ECF subfamily)
VDAITIERARQGDRPAAAALLHALQDPWFRLCRSLLRNEEAAREATQETALRFLRDLPRFRADSSISTWSMGIAINVVREMRRSTDAARVQAHLPRGPAPGGTISPPEAAEATEQQDRVRVILMDLTDRQREVIVLRFFESLNVQETAAVMGCAVGTVKATAHQALRILRKKLEPSG